LIPAGTGAVMKRVKKLAEEQDQIIAASREAAASEAIDSSLPGEQAPAE